MKNIAKALATLLRTTNPVKAGAAITLDPGGTVDGVDVSAHNARHQNGGDDEISLVGLSGLVADEQTPLSHDHTKHTNVSRNLFIPATEGHTEGTASFYVNWPILKLAQSVLNRAWVGFRVPSDYASGGTLKFIYFGSIATSGDIVWSVYKNHATIGEAESSNSSNDTSNVLGILADLNLREATTSITFTDLAKEDYVTIEFHRDGTSGSDNLAADFFLFGFLFEYTAEQ